MKVLVISAFASVALLVFAATMLRSHSRTAEFPFASANPVPVKEPNGKTLWQQAANRRLRRHVVGLFATLMEGHKKSLRPSFARVS